MITTVIISILSVIVVLLGFTTFNLMRKNEKQEDILVGYMKYLNKLTTAIEESDKRLKVIDEKGIEKEINKDQIKFYYRGTDLPENQIILSAILKGSISSKELITRKQEQLIRKKKESQPSQIKTCGSTFKNNNKKKAWQLIKESGCDKFYVGDAKISAKHCNFFVNDGKAKASDIEKLINQVRDEVKLKTGVNLDLEIKIIGYEK